MSIHELLQCPDAQVVKKFTYKDYERVNGKCDNALQVDCEDITRVYCNQANNWISTSHCGKCSSERKQYQSQEY